MEAEPNDDSPLDSLLICSSHFPCNQVQVSSREAAKAGGRERPVQGVPELQSPRTDVQAAEVLVTQLGFQDDQR